MRKTRRALVALICVLVIVLGTGIYFLLSPGYFRNLSTLTPVDPSWDMDRVILYERTRFHNENYVKEETKKNIILKFETVGYQQGEYFYAHCYSFSKKTGRLSQFSYINDSSMIPCNHARAYYQNILTAYGHKGSNITSHQQKYKGMLGGKRYHIAVNVPRGMIGYSERGTVEIVFKAGW